MAFEREACLHRRDGEGCHCADAGEVRADAGATACKGAFVRRAAVAGPVALEQAQACSASSTAIHSPSI